MFNVRTTHTKTHKDTQTQTHQNPHEEQNRHVKGMVFIFLFGFRWIRWQTNSLLLFHQTITEKQSNGREEEFEEGGRRRKRFDGKTKY